MTIPHAALGSIQKDRFWLGDDEYKALSEYLELIRVYANSFEDLVENRFSGSQEGNEMLLKALKQVLNTREEINEKRATIDSVRQHLLSGQ